VSGHVLTDGGYTPPSTHEVFPPSFFEQVPWLDKPFLLVVLSVVILVGFFGAAVRKPAMVPSRLQFTGELIYSFVRNGIGRDVIGSAEYQRFVPFLFALFTFILVNNLYEITPLISFPPMSHIAFPMVLALIVLVVYNTVGIRKQGFGNYFKNVMFIPGVPKFVYPILSPIELLTILLVRPFTLAVRLFANMFAGHMLLLVFMTGAEYMLIEVANPALKAAGLLTGVVAIVMTFFELFVAVFQAYIFALLTALYIGGAVNEAH